MTRHGKPKAAIRVASWTAASGATGARPGLRAAGEAERNRIGGEGLGRRAHMEVRVKVVEHRLMQQGLVLADCRVNGDRLSGRRGEVVLVGRRCQGSCSRRQHKSHSEQCGNEDGAQAVTPYPAGSTAWYTRLRVALSTGVVTIGNARAGQAAAATKSTDFGTVGRIRAYLQWSDPACTSRGI